MNSKLAMQVVLNLKNDIVWDKWSEGARCALSAAFYPAMSLSNSQKGATPEQWEAIRLMRHLFNNGTLPLPNFIEKQWAQVPQNKIDYWIAIGHETRVLVLENTKRRLTGTGVK